MKKYSLKSIIIVAVLSIAFFVLLPILADRIIGINENKNEEEINVAYIGDTKINLEVARTSEERTLGLSYRENLSEDSGMLFVMPRKEVASFWMKDMNFPLDIIWIDGEEVVHISKNLSPGGSIPRESYGSEFPVDLVLEVNGGFTSEKGIRVGDEVKLIF